jgi:Animal haem peroxidase
VLTIEHALIRDRAAKTNRGVLMSEGPSRRDFLKGLGATSAGLVAGTISAGSGLAASPAEAAAAAPSAAAPGSYARGHRGAPAANVDFGRIFPELPPFAEASDAVRAALLEVGQTGGIMDAADQLTAGAKALIVDPTVNGNPTASNPYGTNPDNPTMTAGSTFVGQFTDHDITFDQTSQLGVPQNPLLSPNTRTPALDLDSVFGGGPGLRPDLYVENPDGSVGPKLKTGTGGVHEDVPRVENGDGTYSALLGDPRNDENVIIAGLHCAHILFYNRVLDELDQHDMARFPAAHSPERANRYIQFLLARQVTLWHYQWLLVNEHLPQIAGQAVVNDVLRRANKFYKPPRGDAFMPIEFGAAAYRFGHSMVRPSYRANFTSGTGDSASPTADPFFALVFDNTTPNFSDPVGYDRPDLLGGYPAARRYIGWQTFFDLGDGQVKNNKKIDTTMSSVLFTIPVPAIAPHTQTSPTVLPQRNLLRQLTWGLPSGQAVARVMRLPALSPADLAEIGAVYAPFASSTPLWYYILAEAKVAAGGVNLGPVGGRIVAETLIGLLRADPTSYLSVYPRFRPFLGTDLVLGQTPNPNITGNRTYTRAHFLYYAGVVQPGVYR